MGKFRIHFTGAHIESGTDTQDVDAEEYREQGPFINFLGYAGEDVLRVRADDVQQILVIDE